MYAVQGGITATTESGFYFGTWGSSISFAGSSEIDLFAGYSKKLGDALTVDVGLLYYLYLKHGGGDTDFFEPYINLIGTFGPATLKVGANYAWDQDALASLVDEDGSRSSAIYFHAEPSIAIPGTPLGLNGHLGYAKSDAFPGGFDGDGKVWDWSIGATATYKMLTFGVSYVDTDEPRRNPRLGRRSGLLADRRFLIRALSPLVGMAACQKGLRQRCRGPFSLCAADRRSPGRTLDRMGRTTYLNSITFIVMEKCDDAFEVCCLGPARSPRGFRVQQGGDSLFSTKLPGMNHLAGSDSAAPDIGVTSAPGVAFSYDYRFGLKSAKIAALQERHAAACETLGIDKCRITGLSFSRRGADHATGILELALAPELAASSAKMRLLQSKPSKGRSARSTLPVRTRTPS